MKINAISPLVYSKRNTLNSKQSIIKNNYLAYDEVFFTSTYSKKRKNNTPSKDFLDAIKDESQREDIIKTIIIDSKGKYRKENEELFLKTLNEAKYLLKDDEITYEDNYLPVLIEGTKIALSSIKDEKYDKYLYTINPVNVLAEDAYIALMNGISDVDKIYEVSKSENGKINLMKAQALIYLKTESDVYFDCDSAINFINRFCVTEGHLDYAKMNAVVNAMNAARANDDNQVERLYGLITDKEGNIDTEKYIFVTQAYDLLIPAACSEFKTDDKNIDKDNKDRIFYIINNVIENIKYKDHFDGNKAFEGLKSWLRYVKENKDILNQRISVYINFRYPNGIQQETMTIEELKNGQYSGWQTYDSSIFRLFALLFVQDNQIDKNKVN